MTEPADHTTRLRDRVREQSERIEALEAALRRHVEPYWRCPECLRYGGENPRHEPGCIVGSLPAPETVETQG
jgi:hypothetical protein